jgi:putative ABC transport system substrate-binding protein
MMDRRTFLDAMTSSLLLATSLIQAQEILKVSRVGILSAGSLSRATWTPLLERLRELGWTEDQNLLVEWRGAEGKPQLVPELAAELVRLNVDVIVAVGAIASQAAKAATTTIPLVTFTGDPVRIGLVASMSRPGGNITGVSTIAPGLAAKRLQLLRTMLPTATRIGELVDPANPYIKLIREKDEQAYRTLGLQPVFVEVKDPAHIDTGIAEAAHSKVDALIVRADPIFASNRDQIASLALKHALPTIAEGRLFVSAGCLASYAPHLSDQGLAIAALVDKILRGAKPGELPVWQPTRFELAFNLKTARSLGITIPQSLLLHADEVIR